MLSFFSQLFSGVRRQCFLAVAIPDFVTFLTARDDFSLMAVGSFPDQHPNRSMSNYALVSAAPLIISKCKTDALFSFQTPKLRFNLFPTV